MISNIFHPSVHFIHRTLFNHKLPCSVIHLVDLSISPQNVKAQYVAAYLSYFIFLTSSTVPGTQIGIKYLLNKRLGSMII